MNKRPKVPGILVSFLLRRVGKAFQRTTLAQWALALGASHPLVQCSLVLTVDLRANVRASAGPADFPEGHLLGGER